MSCSRLHNASWDIEWSDAAQETMSDSELHTDSIDVDVSYIGLSCHLAGIFDMTSACDRDDRLHSTRVSSWVDVRSPLLTPYHSNSLLDAHSRPLSVGSWNLLDDDDVDLSTTPVNSEVDVDTRSVAGQWNGQIGTMPISARAPCDGKEASPECASKLPSVPKNSSRFHDMPSNARKHRPALTADLFKEDFARTKTQQENRNVLFRDDCARAKTRRHGHPDGLRARQMKVVKRSMMSWPSNMDSDEQSPSQLPLQRHSSTRHSRVNSRARVSRMSNVATLPRNFAVPTIPESPDVTPARTRVALSNTVNSDATCFMERPLCQPGIVASRLAGKRKTVLVRKLRKIGKYFHRLGGSGGAQVPSQMQTLGVV